MATIDIKLKTYDELIFEITTLNTKLFLKDKEIERLNKEKDDLDDYNRHLHNENKRLNNIINIFKNNIDITIQIIKEQPTGNDEWILERLEGIKNIGELKEGN